MPTFGRQTLGSTGAMVEVAADGFPEWKPGGITIDWATITAVSGSDATYDDGTVVPIGAKGIPFGTILAMITTAEVQTATITGTPTGGTFTLTGNGFTTAALAYNASAATVQAAVRGLGGAYSFAVVTGSAGGPYTITFPAAEGNVAALTASGAGLTGGTSPGVTMATTTSGVSGGGKYGPYDSGASDGRQTLTRGRCYILNQTVTELAAGGLIPAPTDHPAVIEGGLVWRARLRIGGSGQPSVADFETAFPRIRYAQ